MAYEPTDAEKEIIQESMSEFQGMVTGRANFDAHWEEVAELVYPVYRNTFSVGSFNMQGEKKTDRQVDGTASLALSRFAAILDSLLTPRNMYWHFLAADNEHLMKDRETKLWFETATKILFKERYKPAANFAAQNLANYMSLGAFGNAAMWTDSYQGIDGSRGLRYKAFPLGEIYYRENHQGQVDGHIRRFYLTGSQARLMFKDELDRLPDAVVKSTDPNKKFGFLHRVVPRNDRDPRKIDKKNMAYASYYLCLEGPCLVSEGGYRNYPMAASRYDQTPGETYGRSPAMAVLPAIKTLNAEKADFLRQGHRAGTPVYLTTDDGIVDFSMKPGFLNKGGIGPKGEKLVDMLPSGNIQVTKEMMDEERLLINDAFLVTLFQILTESPTMTATEVIERTNEKGILLAPTVGRQQSEYLGQIIPREMNLLAELRLLPPLPPAMVEADGEYTIVYSSPLSRAMRAQEAAGFGRTLQMVQEIVGITQDPAPLDNFNFDVAVPQIAEIQSVPEAWMASPDMVAAKREGRAAAQQQQAAIQAAPGVAALGNAQANRKKAGIDNDAK